MTCVGRTGALGEAWMACSMDSSIGRSWRGGVIELCSWFDGCLELGDGVQVNRTLDCCCSETLPTSVIQTLHCGLSFTLSHVNITRKVFQQKNKCVARYLAMLHQFTPQHTNQLHPWVYSSHQVHPHPSPTNSKQSPSPPKTPPTTHQASPSSHSPPSSPL